MIRLSRTAAVGVTALLMACGGETRDLDKEQLSDTPAKATQLIDPAEARQGTATPADIYNLTRSLDRAAAARTERRKFAIDISPYGADGTLHQRMPYAVKIRDGRLLVIYSQFSSKYTDLSDGRLVSRTVDYDIETQTATVSSATSVIAGTTRGNLNRHPAIVRMRIGPNAGRIILLSNDGGVNPVMRRYSDDDGATWSAPADVTVQGFPRILTNSNIVEIPFGKYTGRLVVAAYNGSQTAFGTLISDDSGISWKAGGTLSASAFPGFSSINETAVALGVDASLVFASRNESLAAANRKIMWSRSTDGGATILPVNNSADVVTSNCSVDLRQMAPLDSDGVPKLLLSRPTSTNGSRKGFRINVSYDNGLSFLASYAPYSDATEIGYSGIVPLGDGQHFFLVVEEGAFNSSQKISGLFLNMAEMMRNGQNF